MSAFNETENALQNGKGKVKEGVGRVIGDDGMRLEGKGDQVAAHAKQFAGKLNESAKRGGRTVRDKATEWVAKFHEQLHEASDKVSDKSWDRPSDNPLDRPVDRPVGRPLDRPGD